MNFNKYVMLALVVLGSFTACEPNQDNEPHPTGLENPTGTGDATDVGTPEGNPVTKNIGPEGGTIQTADQTFSLTIPAGALSASQAITIQPITNKAPNGIGALAYRVTAATEISKAATVNLKVDEQEFTSSAKIMLAYQNSSKIWIANNQTVSDSGPRIITATIGKIKDIDLSFIAAAKMNVVISPTDNHLVLIQPIRLQVWGILEILLRNYPAGTWVAVKAPQVLKDEEEGILNWYANNVEDGNSETGTISHASVGLKNYSGDYGAPVYLPRQNPVTLAVRVKTSKETVLLSRKIQIMQDNHIQSDLGTTTATQAIASVSPGTLTVTLVDMQEDDPGNFTQTLGLEVEKGFTGATGSYRFTYSDNVEARFGYKGRDATGSTTYYDEKGVKRYSTGEVNITSYRKSETNLGFAVIEGTITGTAYWPKGNGYETKAFSGTFKCIANSF